MEPSTPWQSRRPTPSAFRQCCAHVAKVARIVLLCPSQWKQLSGDRSLASVWCSKLSSSPKPDSAVPANEHCTSLASREERICFGKTPSAYADAGSGQCKAAHWQNECITLYSAGLQHTLIQAGRCRVTLDAGCTAARAHLGHILDLQVKILRPHFFAALCLPLLKEQRHIPLQRQCRCHRRCLTTRRTAVSDQDGSSALQAVAGPDQTCPPDELLASGSASRGTVLCRCEQRTQPALQAQAQASFAEKHLVHAAPRQRPAHKEQSLL